MNLETSYANLNETFSSLLITTTWGVKLYCLKSLQVYYENGIRNVLLAERLNSRGVMCVVFSYSPSCLTLILAETCEELSVKSYPEEILALKLNKKVMAVCLTSSIYVHSTKDLEVLITIDSLPIAYRGLCALPAHVVNDKCYLAFPCSEGVGTIRAVEIFSKCDVVTISAHENKIAAITMSHQQSMVATASVKGTIIRVVSIPAGRRLHEFRRGLQRSSTIYSLAFSSDSSFLCCSGSTGTIHIFKLRDSSDDSSGWVSSIGSLFQPLNYFLGRDTDMTAEVEEEEDKPLQTWSSLVTSSALYVPQQLCRVAGQSKSFARARLPRSGFVNVSIVETNRRSGQVYVISEDGYLYYFTMDVTNGGECVMQNQCRVTEFSGSLYFLENHECSRCRLQSLKTGGTRVRQRIAQQANEDKQREPRSTQSFN